MKKTIALLLCVLMAASLLAGCMKKKTDKTEKSGESAPQFCKTATVNGVTRDNQSWQYVVLSDGTAKLVGYMDFGVETNLPEKVDGRTVSTLGRDTFAMSLTPRVPDYEIVIPDCITVIEGNPFDFQEAGAHLTIRVSASHPTLEVNDGELFEKQPRRLISVFSVPSDPIPAGTEIVEDHAFRRVLIGPVNIPASVKTIGKNPFAYRKTYMWASEFTGITVDPSNPYFEIRDGLLYDKQNERIICASRLDFMSRIDRENNGYAVPEGTKAIDDQALSYCGLTKLSIPASVTQIGNMPVGPDAEIVVSPDNATFVVTGGVLYDKAQKRVVQMVDRYNAPAVTIPQGAEIIDETAFSACLTEIVIPDTVKEIRAYAFTMCQNGVRIPANVQKICPQAFIGAVITNDVLVLNGPVEIGGGGFCAYNYDESGAEFSAEIRIENGAILHSNAFGLRPMERVTIGGSSRIARVVFQNCSNLTEVTLSEGLTALCSDAFTDCPNIETMKLPKSLEWIVGVSDVRGVEGADIFSNSFYLETLQGPGGRTATRQIPCRTMTLLVYRDSYAEQFCKQNGLEFQYAD